MRQLWRGQGPALGLGEGWWAGYTGEGVWRVSSADNVTSDRPRCTREEGPAQEVERGGETHVRRELKAQDTPNTGSRRPLRSRKGV